MCIKRMSDLIFIGPQAAGKTTLFEVLQGHNPPTVHNATQSNGGASRIRTSAKMVLGGLLRGRVSIIDAGGKDSEFNRYRDWCQQAKKVFVVFNGVELLKEMKKPETGGVTSSFIKRTLAELNEINAPRYFVATFADVYYRDYGSTVSMTEAITERMGQVNTEYNELCDNGGAKRYPMANDMFGSLYEVNATDHSSVVSVFRPILDN